MKLEVNLVKSMSVYSSTFTYIARKRFNCANDGEVMSAIEDFIKDNIDTIGIAVRDKGFVSQLSNVHGLTIDTLYSLKFRLAMYGLDILFFSVADKEVNEIEIPEGILEYNVIDQNDTAGSSFVKFDTKVAVEKDTMLSVVYEKILGMYGMFEGDLFSQYKNPIKIQLGILKANEEQTGKDPSLITTYINSVLEYHGKNFIVIAN